MSLASINLTSLTICVNLKELRYIMEYWWMADLYNNTILIILFLSMLK